MSTVMTSTIVIDGQTWNLSAPPLNIGVRLLDISYKYHEEHHPGLDDDWKVASEFWYGIFVNPTLFSVNLIGDFTSDELFTYNDALIEESVIEKTGRCIAQDEYAWGFSSLLLLTFCCYTSAFALALILLQTDVYWNSRHDRDHWSHSMYTDVLYIAEELKKTFGQNVEDHMESPKAFDKRVGSCKQGLRLDVRELPLSRWQEWRISRATKRANRKTKIALASATQSTLELRNLSSHHRGESDSKYHGLIGDDGAESSIEVVFRPDRRSTTGELEPSLAGRQTSTEGSVLEDSISEKAA